MLWKRFVEIRMDEADNPFGSRGLDEIERKMSAKKNISVRQIYFQKYFQIGATRKGNPASTSSTERLFLTVPPRSYNHVMSDFGHLSTIPQLILPQNASPGPAGKRAQIL